MMEKKSKSVTVENLFEGQKTAGLPFGDWLALSPAEKLVARLGFILDRAEALHQQTHTEGLPGELWSLSQRLDSLIRKTLATIKQDFVAAYDQMIDIGMLMQEIRLLPALHSALKTWTFEVTDRCSKGGQATAVTNKEKKEARKEKVIQKYHSLSGRPEREKAGIIAENLGMPAQKVREYLREYRKANGR